MSRQLTADDGRGFAEKSLRRMIQFARVYADREIVEEPPLGQILCAGKSDEHVELLRLDRSGIRVATYLTELPSRRLLERKLREMTAAARARLDVRRPDRS